MSTLPDFTGPGFFAGEAPDGLTTVAGTPTSAQVRVYWRDPADPQAPDVLVASTQSAADGTWQIAGLDPALRYVVRAQKSQFDDVTVVGAMPSRSDVIAYVDHLEPTEDFDGLTGYVLLDSGLPPFTCEVIQPLPYGLSARIEGRKLLIEGVSSDNGLWEIVVRVTARNGVWVDVPVQVQIHVLRDPHWDKVVALLHFDGDLTDETGRVWGTLGLPTFEYVSPIYGAGSFKTNGKDAAQTANLGLINDNNEPYCIEFTFKTISLDKYGAINPLFWCFSSGPYGDSVIGVKSSTGLFAQLHSGTNSWIVENNLAPILLDTVYHLAITYDGSDLRIFLNGSLVYRGIGLKIQTPNSMLRFGTLAEGWYMQGSNHIYDELRITKGVARYTANFTPPDKPFSSR